MKNSGTKKISAKLIFINSLILCVFALLWNAFIHLVVLKEQNNSLEAIHRPDLNEKMWISILVTFAIAFLFTVSHFKWQKNNTKKEALIHSLFFGTLTAIIVDLNQYVLYNIPFNIILSWMLFGFIEFIIYGQITYKINKHSIVTR